MTTSNILVGAFFGGSAGALQTTLADDAVMANPAELGALGEGVLYFAGNLAPNEEVDPDRVEELVMMGWQWALLSRGEIRKGVVPPSFQTLIAQGARECVAGFAGAIVESFPKRHVDAAVEATRQAIGRFGDSKEVMHGVMSALCQRREAERQTAAEVIESIMREGWNVVGALGPHRKQGEKPSAMVWLDNGVQVLVSAPEGDQFYVKIEYEKKGDGGMLEPEPFTPPVSADELRARAFDRLIHPKGSHYRQLAGLLGASPDAVSVDDHHKKVFRQRTDSVEVAIGSLKEGDNWLVVRAGNNVDTYLKWLKLFLEAHAALLSFKPPRP